MSCNTAILVLNTNGYRKFKLSLDQLYMTNRESYDKLLELLYLSYTRYIDSANNKIMYFWKDVDLNSYHITKLLRKLLKELKPEEYLFIRIGNTQDDIEELGNFNNNPFNAKLKTEISIHFFN